DGQEGWIFRTLVTFTGVALGELPVSGETTSVTTTPTTPSETTAPTTTTTTSSSGIQKVNGVYQFAIGVGPGGNTNADGRLNPYTYLGYSIIYCVNGDGYTDRGTYRGGGIAINLW